MRCKKPRPGLRMSNPDAQRGAPLQGFEAPEPTSSGGPAEEYKIVCAFMRQYSMMRFYQLALLLGTTSSIVTALSLNASRMNFTGATLLKGGGLFVCLALLVMAFRATSYWHRLRNCSIELAHSMRYATMPASSRWNPLTTSGAGFYLHATVTTLWLVSLFFRFQTIQ